MRPGAFLGGDATVHDPDAVGLAVLVLDLLQEALEGGFVCGVAGHDFIGEREAIRGDPLLLLAVVDLAEIKDGVLDDPPALAAAVFHQRPIIMLLAVLPTFGAAQKHNSYGS